MQSTAGDEGVLGQGSDTPGPRRGVVFQHSPGRLAYHLQYTVPSKRQARTMLGLAPDHAVKLIDAAVWAAEGGAKGTPGTPQDPERPRDLPLWTSDIHDARFTGAKHYRVQAVREFWLHYDRLAPEERTFYELIRPARPCKGYFDLEFDRHNDELRAKDMDTVVGVVKERVRAALHRYFGAATVEPVRFLELCSDKPTKASRHLVFLMGAGDGGSVAFTSVEDLQTFVQLTFPALTAGTQQTVEERESEPALLWRRQATAKTHAGELAHCIDGGVYHGNRSFRLWKSRKFGKQESLEASDGSEPTLETFTDSLVGTHRRGLRRLLSMRLPQSHWEGAEPTMWVGAAQPPGAAYAALAPHYGVRSVPGQGDESRTCDKL